MKARGECGEDLGTEGADVRVVDLERDEVCEAFVRD
jgi:hypothetical protein